MAKRKAYDWEAIEREYRAGQLSVREIAAQAGCSHTAINKKAKASGWSRDLAAAVRKEVSNKLVSTEVSRSNAEPKEIIEAAANRGVNVITTHRKDIANLREIEQKLIEELNGEPTKLYITQYQGQIVQEEVGLTVAERSAAAANLAQVQHKRIALERQAFNLNDDAATPDPKGELCTELMEKLDEIYQSQPGA